MTAQRTQTRPATHVAAVFLFTIAALWTSRAVLQDPATFVTQRVPSDAVWTADMRRNVAQIAYASRRMSHDPARFFEGPMCYPIADSVSLGEHMLGEGLLGIPAHLLWADPIVTFNFVVGARPLLGALSMYALAFYWTGSAAAALIAGFSFGFHPIRLRDLTHPSVVGNEWIPAVLLALHLLFAKRRWRDAILLAGFAALQMLESFYILLQLTLAVGVYATYLLWRYRRSLATLLPKLSLVAALLVALAAWTLGPYLTSRDVWGILQGRTGFPTLPRFLGFGGPYFPGTCLLLLAAIGVLDRLRAARRERGYDPRWLWVCMILVAWWFVLPLRLAALDLVIPPLRALLADRLPGLDAVRAPGNVFFVAAVPLAAVAAYGVLALVEKSAPRLRTFIVAGLAVACVAEVFHPALATRSFGKPVPSTALSLRPETEDLAALAELPPGPVLDFPLSYDGAGPLFLSRPILLGAYHGQRQAACKASFITPVQREIAKIAERLPNPAAAQEIWALGLRTIIFHEQSKEATRRRASDIVKALSKPSSKPRLRPVASGKTIRVFRLEAGGPSTNELSALVPVNGNQGSRPGAETELRFGVRSSGSTFRHPDPVQPSDVVVTWRRDGQVTRSEHHRVLLPVALALNRSTELTVRTRAPRKPGPYVVTLALATDPDRPMGRRRVTVVPPPETD